MGVRVGAEVAVGRKRALVKRQGLTMRSVGPARTLRASRWQLRAGRECARENYALVLRARDGAEDEEDDEDAEAEAEADVRAAGGISS